MCFCCFFGSVFREDGSEPVNEQKVAETHRKITNALLQSLMRRVGQVLYLPCPFFKKSDLTLIRKHTLHS